MPAIDQPTFADSELDPIDTPTRLERELASAHRLQFSAISHLRALLFISRKQETNPKEIGAHFKISGGSVTVILDALEKLGLIIKDIGRAHPVTGRTDRRVTVVSLSPAGFEAVLEINDLDLTSP
ncbi:MAG: MarR family transcriptional regulator [Verrucomicrobiota bacterium]